MRMTMATFLVVFTIEQRDEREKNVGKASRKKKDRKRPAPEIDYMERVQKHLCLHCGAPLDWSEGDDLTQPRTWHCRKCTARGRNTIKKHPSQAEIVKMARAAIAWLEEQERKDTA